MASKLADVTMLNQQNQQNRRARCGIGTGRVALAFFLQEPGKTGGYRRINPIETSANNAPSPGQRRHSRPRLPPTCLAGAWSAGAPLRSPGKATASNPSGTPSRPTGWCDRCRTAPDCSAAEIPEAIELGRQLVCWVQQRQFGEGRI